MGGNDLSRDLTATKSFSQFLVEISTKIPEYVLPNLSYLNVHLDGDVSSYFILIRDMNFYYMELCLDWLSNFNFTVLFILFFF